MAMRIVVEDCLACSACVYVCPREAISEQHDDQGNVVYVIDGRACTECLDEGVSQCREECPVPECIVKAVSS